MADGSLHSLAICAESTYGTAPTAPTWDNLPLSSFSGGLSFDTLIDDTIRADRNIVDVRNGAKKVQFELPVKPRYGAYDQIIEACLCGTWTGNVLKNGVTYRSFTTERKFADISDKPYIRHLGTEVNKWSLNVKANNFVESSFGFMAQNVVDDASQIASSTYNAAPTSNRAFDSFTGSISEGGSAIGVVSEIAIEMTNNMELRPVVGSPLTLRPSKLLFNVSGTMTTYFNSAALLDKFLGSTSTSVTLVLTDKGSNSWTISLPSVFYVGDGNADVKGPGPVMQALKFQAVYNASAAATIQITRAPAAT